MLPLAYLKRQVLDVLWAGTAVGADELTLLRELQDVCVKRVMPESAQDGSDTQLL